MIMLLSFMCVSWCYASEQDNLLPQDLLTFASSDLHNTVKISYYSEKIENCFSDPRLKDIYFYNPVKDNVCAFQLKEHLAQVFKDNNMPPLKILLSEKLNNFVNDNTLKKELLDNFISFFKELDAWCTYAHIPENMWRKRWVYNLHHFFYITTSSKNASDKNSTYNLFFNLFKEDAANLYNEVSKPRKDLLFFGNAPTIVMAGIFTWHTALATDFFTTSIKNNFGAEVLVSGAVIFPITSLSLTITIYLINYIGYQKFLKNLENINLNGEDLV